MLAKVLNLRSAAKRTTDSMAFSKYLHRSSTMHREDFIHILDNVNLSNKKLQSVVADLKCGVVCTFLQALAIAFLRKTGPYYNLMESNVPYLEMYSYIQSLYEYLQVGSADA